MSGLRPEGDVLREVGDVQRGGVRRALLDVTKGVTEETENVMPGASRVDSLGWKKEPGAVCPTCGHRQAGTAAQRQAKWRARNAD